MKTTTKKHLAPRRSEWAGEGLFAGAFAPRKLAPTGFRGDVSEGSARSAPFPGRRPGIP